LVTVETSIAKLQSEHNKALREIDGKIEELKRSIPERILKMKLSDVMKLKDFTDVCIEERMTNLNVTVMETIQKADEGKSKFGVWCHFHDFLLSPLSHLSLSRSSSLPSSISITCH
jgi:hypothetical protein